MRVAVVVTCFNDTLFPGIGRAVVQVLERLGVQVEFPLLDHEEPIIDVGAGWSTLRWIARGG